MQDSCVIPRGVSAARQSRHPGTKKNILEGEGVASAPSTPPPDGDPSRGQTFDGVRSFLFLFAAGAPSSSLLGLLIQFLELEGVSGLPGFFWDSPLYVAPSLASETSDPLKAVPKGVAQGMATRATLRLTTVKGFESKTLQSQEARNMIPPEDLNGATAVLEPSYQIVADPLHLHYLYVVAHTRVAR